MPIDAPKPPSSKKAKDKITNIGYITGDNERKKVTIGNTIYRITPNSVFRRTTTEPKGTFIQELIKKFKKKVEPGNVAGVRG